MPRFKCPPVPNRDQRLRICNLFIGMAKEVCTDIFGATRNWGAEIDGMVIACAVLIGHAEDRPMTASKLSLYLGMPRTTVSRKLRLLEELDVVVETEKGSGKYLISNRRFDRPTDKSLVSKMICEIDRAAKRTGPNSAKEKSQG